MNLKRKLSVSLNSHPLQFDFIPPFFLDIGCLRGEKGMIGMREQAREIVRMINFDIFPNIDIFPNKGGVRAQIYG